MYDVTIGPLGVVAAVEVASGVLTGGGDVFGAWVITGGCLDVVGMAWAVVVGVILGFWVERVGHSTGVGQIGHVTAGLVVTLPRTNCLYIIVML